MSETAYGSGTAPGFWPPPESLRPTLVGERYMVSAGHPLVADVAASVFERGGNAVDAGVAGGIAANVIQPDMCNLGGIAPIVIRQGDSGRVWSVSGVGTWSNDVSVDAHRRRHGGGFPAGGACAVIPGAPAAWIGALSDFGTWSFTETASFAIEAAMDGVRLDRRLAESLEICGRNFSGWESSREIYWPAGRAPVVGERLVQRDLGRLLTLMSDAEQAELQRGASRSTGLAAARRAFYDGQVGASIARFVVDAGGWMTIADLAKYEAEIEPAVSGAFGDWQIHVNDTWSQGPVILQTLNILDLLEIDRFEHNGTDYLHLLVESLKLAFSDREKWYGDPNAIDVPLERLLSREHTATLAAMIRMDSALPNLPTMADRRDPGLTHGHRHLDTTSISTVDAAGNAFSAAMSDTLDDSPIVPGLGIMVSPRGAQSRLAPGHPAALGPGRRPRITPAPMIATGQGVDGSEVWPISCPGGDTITQAIVQAFLNTAAFGMTLQQAVEAPRVGAYNFPDTFFPNSEADGLVRVESRIPEHVRAQLAGRGHNVELWPPYEFDAGGVTMTLSRPAPDLTGPVLSAAADPRRSCYARGR